MKNTFEATLDQRRSPDSPLGALRRELGEDDRESVRIRLQSLFEQAKKAQDGTDGADWFRAVRLAAQAQRAGIDVRAIADPFKTDFEQQLKSMPNHTGEGENTALQMARYVGYLHRLGMVQGGQLPDNLRDYLLRSLNENHDARLALWLRSVGLLEEDKLDDVRVQLPKQLVEWKRDNKCSPADHYEYLFPRPALPP